MAGVLRSHRSRGGLSVVLVVLATAFALTGGVALYVRQEIVTSGAFADRATGALERDAVRRVVSREIVVQLIDRGSTDLISARPVLESVVDFVVASEPFRRVFRRAALEANRVLFVRDEGNVAVDIGDAGTVVASALRSVAPDLARKIPPDADAKLLELQQRSFATKTLRFADSVRLLGLVLPALAVLGYALAIVVAPDRRAAVTRAGIAIGAAAALLLIALLALRTAVVARAPGKDELTDKEVGEAVRAIWDAYLRDLSEWALAIGAVALLVAAASASLLRPFSAERSLARLRTRLRPPETAAWRAARGVALLAVGVFVVFDPGLALEILAVVAGALLVYCGAGEALSAIQPAGRAGEEAARRGARRGVLVAGGVIVATVAGLGIWIAAGGSGREAEAGLPRTCNGYVELCDRRLDQVTFAGSHNSMSAADSPGWLLTNQRRTIRRQLRDGIRLFLIDPHYGRQASPGEVRTDFAAERTDLNRVGKTLTPRATQAFERLGGRLGAGSFSKGKRDVWLCHSVCELGATRMVDALADIRHFLERNRGEVVVLFDEDYVSERDLDRVYRESGLYPHLATLRRDRPLPTLRQLIRSGKRVVVFTERVPSGRYEWDNEGFSFVQDTPLGATKPSAFRCARNRGAPDSPLLMINNWIDRFPPPLGANRAVLRRGFITRRARRCARARGMRANLIASDFYDQGQLVGAVRQLNGLDHAPAPTR